jgi:hypothetical protein
MTDTELIAGRYLAVWSEPDPELRRKAIAELWTRDGVEFVEGKQFRGHEELDARIAHAYTEFVATGRFTVASAPDVTGYGPVVVLTIALVAPDGEVAWAARVFLILDSDGLIREDYQLTVKNLN